MVFYGCNSFCTLKYNLQVGILRDPGLFLWRTYSIRYLMHVNFFMRLLIERNHGVTLQGIVEGSMKNLVLIFQKLQFGDT